MTRPAGARRWRAVRDTPLAAMAEALLHRDGLYGKLLELGLTSTVPDRRSRFRACGFDTQNGWHWLDVEVDRSVLDAWADTAKQREVRALLDTRLIYFKPKGEVIRLWWIPERRKKQAAAE